MFCTLSAIRSSDQASSSETKTEALAKHGVLIFNDDDSEFSAPDSFPGDIISAWCRSVATGLKHPPMAFVHFPKSESVATLQGALLNSGKAVVFRAVVTGPNKITTEDYNVEVGPLAIVKNKDLCSMAFDNYSRVYPSIEGHGKALSLVSIKKDSLAVGVATVRHWVGSLVVGRAALTLAFFRIAENPKTCSPNRNWNEIFPTLRRAGKKPVTIAPKSWLMWYPSAKPFSLEKWLQFLKEGKLYTPDDIISVSPCIEGLYRFAISIGSAPGICNVIFDDASGESTTEVHGHVITSPHAGSRHYLQISVPMHLCVPSDRKVASIGAKGLRGRDQLITCRILPSDKEFMLTGYFGPVRTLFDKKSKQWYQKVQKGRKQKNLMLLARNINSDAVATMDELVNVEKIIHSQMASSVPRAEEEFPSSCSAHKENKHDAGCSSPSKKAKLTPKPVGAEDALQKNPIEKGTADKNSVEKATDRNTSTPVGAKDAPVAKIPTLKETTGTGAVRKATGKRMERMHTGTGHKHKTKALRPSKRVKVATKLRPKALGKEVKRSPTPSDDEMVNFGNSDGGFVSVPRIGKGERDKSDEDEDLDALKNV